MSKKNLNLNLLNNSQKNESIKEIISFFEKERDEEIGNLASEKVLEFFLEKIGDKIYNKAIDDSKETFKLRLEDIELDLEVLKK